MGQGSCSLSFCDLHLQKEPHFATVLWEFLYFALLHFKAGASIFRSVTPDNGGRGTDCHASLHLGCNHLVEFHRPGVRGTTVQKLVRANVMGADGRRLSCKNTNCCLCDWNQSLAVIFALLPDGCCDIVSHTPHACFFSGPVTFSFGFFFVKHFSP